MLALVGNLFYVLVYTRWLKRSTPQNIVIGGAAGAVPPLVGYAAATGQPGRARARPVPDRLPLDAAALLGARAADPARLRGRADPDAAGRARRRETARQIVCYSLVLVAATLVPVAWHTAGSSTSPRPLVLGAIFLRLALAAAARDDAAARAARSSTTRCSTSRCSSSRWRSTRCSADGADDPTRSATNLTLGPRALRRLPRLLALTCRRRVRLPRARLTRPGGSSSPGADEPGARASGSRSRTSSTRPGVARRTARPCSPTTCRPTTAEAVRRLEAAGYVDVGKTNLHEFAYGVTSQNPHYGTVPNPLAPGRIAGRLERRLGGGDRGRARRRRRSAPTRAARSGSRPRAAASSGSSRRTALVPMDGVLPARAELRPRGADGARRRGLRRADARRSADGFEPSVRRARRAVEVGVAWLEQRRPARARARRGRPRRCSRDAGRSTSRSPATGLPPFHARGRRRPPRALRGARRAVRREHVRRRSSAASP